MASTARALVAIAAIIIAISSLASSAMATAPAPEPEGFSVCEDISGTWTTDAARFVELESTDPENPSNSENSMTAADKDWGMEMTVSQYDCVFTANLTVADDDGEVFKKQYAGTIQPLPSGSSRLVIEEAIPMSGSGDVPLWYVFSASLEMHAGVDRAD